MVDNHSGHHLKILRSNRGGEYTFKLFESFCKKHGIIYQLTASFTPQRNSVATRKNRTILDMTRSMVKRKSLPRNFFVEAVVCVVYLPNRCPITGVKFKTPCEAWGDRIPFVGHLIIFGCFAYVYIPNQKRKNPDDKGENVYLLDMTKEARLTNFTISRQRQRSYVEFDETNYWRWIEKDKKIQGLLFDDNVNDNFDVQHEQGDDITPQLCPIQETFVSTLETSSISTSTSRNNLGRSPRKMRTIDDLHDATSPMSMQYDYSLFCLLGYVIQ